MSFDYINQLGQQILSSMRLQTNFNKVDVGGLVADSRLLEKFFKNLEEKQPNTLFIKLNNLLLRIINLISYI